MDKLKYLVELQLIEQIRDKLERESLSVLKLSNKTGIPAYRIYKWLDNKGNPKADDAKTINQWLNGELEEVPIYKEGGNPELDQPLPLGDLRVTLKDYVDLLTRWRDYFETQNKELMAALTGSLSTLAANSTETNILVRTILNEQSANDKVIMDNQDTQMHQQPGSSAAKAGMLELKMAQALKQKDKQAGTHMRGKADRS